ncbi:MAG: SpoIIE family protein phosphatase [Bacteroidales bacterium]|nr:SpoIIE family protein phosphatase [Bacteroidales bacterium]
MYRYIIVIILTVFSFYESLAQTPQMKKISDSLAVRIIQCTDTTKKLRIYSEFLTYNTDIQNLNYFITSCENLTRNREDSIILINCYLNYSYSSMCTSDYDPKLIENYLQKGIRISRKLNDKEKLALLYYYEAICCEAEGNITGMLDYSNVALENYQANNDIKGIITIELILGQALSKINMYQKAYEHFFKAELLSTEINDSKSKATSEGFIGIIMYQQFQNEKNNSIKIPKLKQAINFCNLTINEFNKYDNIFLDEIVIMDMCYITKAQCYLKFAEIYNDKKYTDSCSLYLNKVHNNLFDNEINRNIAEAELLNYKKQYSKAIEILLNTETKINSNSSINYQKSKIYYLISESYNGLKRYKEATEYIDKADYYENLNIKENSQKQYAEFKAKTIYERKIQLITDEKIRQEIEHDNNIKIQEIKTYSIIIGIGLTIIIILIFMYTTKIYRKNYKKFIEHNNKLNIINQEIINKKSEIESQHEMIMMQKDIVDSINESMTSSIKYAYKIQSSIMPKFTEIQKYFTECFVIFRPRDIVSGDFYLVSQKGNYKIIIMADCTGHGVPGGLLSMLGISAINDILRQTKFDDNFMPSIIINKLREFIISTFSNTNKDNSVCDGMDMTICAIDTEQKKLKFASANQSIFIWNNGNISRLKGDKMPVGRYIIENKDFTTQEIDIKENSMIYLLTDGIQDQLGGISHKKFMISNVIKLFENIGHKSAEEQFNIVNNTIDNWKKNVMQVDDMSMIGVRV